MYAFPKMKMQTGN